jgi:hypothetical protein
MTLVAPRKPKAKPPTWADIEKIWRTDAQLADLADTIPRAAELKAQVAELNQVWRANAHALFQRIQSQAEIFTVADRKELMDFANKAVNGGLILAALQEGGRRAMARHTSGKNARNGNSAKAATWHAKAEELAVDLWTKRQIFHGNASSTAAEISTSLSAVYPEARKPNTVAKYLSGSEVRARLDKAVAAKMGSCG